MSEYTLVGDPHAKPDNLEKIAALFDLVERKGNPVIWTGDMLDTKEIVRSKCLNLWIKLFSQSKLHHYILIGNHDLHSVESKEHSLEPLKLLENVTIIDHPQRVGLAVYAIPYTHSVREFLKMVETSCNRPILLMHQGISGFDYGNGLIAENETPLEALAQFKLVIGGHFHKYQKSKNLVYIGTPFSHSFGETDQDKYIGILDTETCTIKTIPTKFPKHRTIVLNCDEEELKPQNFEKGYVRVLLTGTTTAVASFDQAKYPGIKFIEQPSDEILAKANVSETDSNEQKFVKWATEIKSLSKETIQLGLEVLKNV